MRMTMTESVNPSRPKTEDAREFMQKIKECSQSIWLITTTKKFDWSQPIHDHVKHMSNLEEKLTTLRIEAHERFLVQFIMNSLPFEFSQF
ncbi:hypothetical protein V2J09_016377 [Rumex salicifolius]